MTIKQNKSKREVMTSPYLKKGHKHETKRKSSRRSEKQRLKLREE